jgi:hypothetical protein
VPLLKIFTLAAMDTARRSSRAARASQPLQSTSQHSSASSNSSGRADRATRSHNKTESPRKSTPSGSLSSEPPDESTIAITVDDAIQTRRKRGRAEEREKSTKAQSVQVEMSNGADEVGEDDEAVRCICGFDEYPGPPQLDEDNKNGIKEGIEDPLINPADVTEDLAGFFLQCDTCKVWQHGGCVGIMNEDTSPEEYYCEECRKDLHRIFTASNGCVMLELIADSQFLCHFIRAVSPDARTWRRSSLTRLAAPDPQNFYNELYFLYKYRANR